MTGGVSSFDIGYWMMVSSKLVTSILGRLSKHNSQTHNPLALVLAVLENLSLSTYSLVSARVFLIPLMYSKVILKGNISMAQLLTLECRVFLAKNFFRGR